MQQHQRLPVQETIQPGRHIHGSRTQRKIAVELTHDFSAFQQLLVQQQTAGHAAQQRRCGIPHGQAAQCQAPGIHRLLRLAVAGAQPQGLVRRQHLGLHGSRSILIHGHAGNRQTDGGAQHQRIDHAGQQGGIRLAHTAIAIDIGQRRQSLQQLGHIARGGCTLGQRGDQCLDQLRQIGQQRIVDGLRYFGQRGLGRQAGAQLGRGGLGHGGAVHAGLDDAHRQLGLPLQLPAFAESASIALGIGGAHAPVDAQQAQTVQKMAARQIRVLAQIQCQQLACRLGLEAQRLLLLLDITLQRHLGNIGGHLAQHMTDGQFLIDQPERCVLAHADHGDDGFVDFFQAGHGLTAQRRQTLGQPRGLDDVSAGAVQILVAQQMGHACQPARRAQRGRRNHVFDSCLRFTIKHLRLI